LPLLRQCLAWRCCKSYFEISLILVSSGRSLFCVSLFYGSQCWARWLPRASRTTLVLRIVSFVGKAFSALVCGVVAYYAFLYVQFEFIDETIEFAQVPTWVCQSIIPVGFSVMALRFGLQAILSLVRGAPS
jgi:hypothetical protein